MASTRDAEGDEALGRLQAASLELTRLVDISEITEIALPWALELTHSSLAFISLGGESHAADRTYSRGLDGRRYLTRDEVDRLLHAGTGESSLVHTLHSAGRQLGVTCVTKDAAYTEQERSMFAIFANQLGAVIGAAAVQISRHTASLQTQLDARTEELTQTVERLQTVNAARQLLMRNVVTAQDKAAKRFAGELHDDALQKLTAAELHLQRARSESGAEQSALADAQMLLAETEESLRRLLFEVRPPMLETPGGLEATIRERASMVRSLTDAEVVVDIDLPDDLAYEHKSMVFRQVAEALTNVEKHSHATKVELSLRITEGALHGVVSDNGDGFVVAERNNLPGHLGLLSLRERAILAGGWYKIDSAPGKGTRIEFGLPLS